MRAILILAMLVALTACGGGGDAYEPEPTEAQIRMAMDDRR